MLGYGPVVRLVNRVVDGEGKPVPQRYILGGEDVRIVDALDVPWGLARILINQSMFRLDPMSGDVQYKLGGHDLSVGLDLPTDPIPVDTLGDELIDWGFLPPGAKVERHTFKNRIVRHTPLAEGSPGADQDGVHPGTFTKL